MVKRIQPKRGAKALAPNGNHHPLPSGGFTRDLTEELVSESLNPSYLHE